MQAMRLQKYLSTAGVCSRRKGESYITSGRVKVNGRVVTELGAKIDPLKDSVLFDNKPVTAEKRLVYIALNKPAGYVSSCSQKKEKIILELLTGVPERIYPVGRLDKESTGLILLTNDGSLHQAVSHPSFDHEKEYDVTLASPISDKDLEKMGSGIVLDGQKTRPAMVRRISKRRFRIILKEGKNRQIRRMAEKVGNRVDRLKRLRISNIRIGNLDEGNWRYLRPEEIDRLKTEG